MAGPQPELVRPAHAWRARQHHRDRASGRTARRAVPPGAGDCAPSARNYARGTGEIDLVMLDGDALAFVEVRYRGGGAWTSGTESVDAGKRRRLVRTAEAYLREHPEHRYRGIRFDVVSASKGNYGIACEWIRDAFDATDC